MSKTNDKLANLGIRLCEYAKSVGCKVEWKTAYLHSQYHGQYLMVKAPGDTYSVWESLNYACGERNKWRAYQEFASFVINNRHDYDEHFSLTDLECSPILNALAYVMIASSAEELDLRLALLGF